VVIVTAELLPDSGWASTSLQRSPRRTRGDVPVTSSAERRKKASSRWATKRAVVRLCHCRLHDDSFSRSDEAIRADTVCMLGGLIRWRSKPACFKRSASFW
jgi:hypothetical protein